MENIKEVISILPISIRQLISSNDRLNKLQEIRIRVNKPIIFQIGEEELVTRYTASINDVRETIKRMSNYSIYAYDEEIRQGYITIKGGHRVGICGKCVIEGERIKTINHISSFNIRICREILGVSNNLMKYIIKDNEVNNTLIISAPKCGKTTLLRDMTRNISNGIESVNFKGQKVCVIDERSEIAGCMDGLPQLDIGIRTDVLDNCPKSYGIMMAIRSMSPDVIVCDEIGTSKDIKSIIKAMNSGVKLITSVHGYDVEDILQRPVFKEAIDNKIFNMAIILSNKKGAGTVEGIYDFNKKATIF